MKKKVDLNCDIGEGFGAYHMDTDSEIIRCITSANIACGFHASDPLIMDQTVQIALHAGVGLGAHPGYPDLMGFGRRNLQASPAEVQAYVTYQLGALHAFARSRGGKLSHVKPHGAMYNMAAKDPSLARAICTAIYQFDKNLILLGLSGSCMLTEAEKMGLSVAREVFADRAYESDGTLVARTKPGAMIQEEEVAVTRVVRMVQEGRVQAVDGTDIAICADSICVHGDSPKALLFTQKIRTALEDAGVQIVPLAEVVRD